MRKRYKKQKTVVILFALGIICCFSIGYAAFSQNFLVSGKGTVVEPDDGTVTPNKLIKKAVTSGDGLYEDTTEEGRYIYKGESPNNYITFNNETWRIMSLDKEENTEKYNLKIIRNESIGSKVFDSDGIRKTGYCSKGYAKYYGCNAWMATDNYVNGTYEGTVDKDSELNIYLNGEYYNSLDSNAKLQLQDRNFNVGGIEWLDKNLESMVLAEKSLTSTNKIALITISEYLRTIKETVNLGHLWDTTMTADCSTSVKTSWMYGLLNSKYLRTVSPDIGNTSYVLSITDKGCIAHTNVSKANTSYETFPVLYLTSDIKLLGEGTQDNPYTIVNN